MARVVSIVNRTGANAVKFDTMRNDFMKDTDATRVDVEGPVFSSHSHAWRICTDAQGRLRVKA